MHCCMPVLLLSQNRAICCPADLCNGICGGAGCDLLPGGFDNCCLNGVLARNALCKDNLAPCVKPQLVPAPTAGA